MRTRPRLPLLLPAALAAALLTLPTVTTAAEDMAPGTERAGEETFVVNAAAYQPLEGKRPVAVRLYEDSDSQIRLKTAIEQALRGDGWTVVEDGSGAEAAPLRVSFDVTSDELAGPAPHEGILTLEGRDGNRVEQQYSARLKMFSSSGSSLMTGTREPGDVTRSRPMTRFQLYLTDATNGRRLWEGWATTELGAESPSEAAQAIVPRLVSLIGRTVRDQGPGH